MLLPESIEVTPVDSAEGYATVKKRRGRPRKRPKEEEADEEEAAGRMVKSPSEPQPPSSKRTRDLKIVSYSSYGRPRRSTARARERPEEEEEEEAVVSDEQRGK